MDIKKAYSSYVIKYSATKGYHKDYVSFVVKGLIIVNLISLLYSLTFFLMDFKLGCLAMGITSLLLFICLLGFRTKLKISRIANSYVLICISSLLFCITQTGGITSPILPWLICIPFFASLILKTIELWAWIGITTFSISALSISFSNGWIAKNLLTGSEYLNILTILLNIGLLITLSVLTYINWTYLYKKKRKKLKKDILYIDEDEIDYFILNWNFVKSKIGLKAPKVIKQIDELHFFTDHEKKYALIRFFRLDTDLLAEKLNVSKRTIETNLYRVKTKMKKNNINPDILFKNS